MKRFLLIALTLLILSACTVTEPGAEPVQVTRVVATIASPSTATSTPKPTASPTTIPTKTPIPTLTQTSLPPSPIIPSTITPTETALPDQYDLPSWIVDPNTNILAIKTMDDWHNENYAVSFFNAGTGERYDIPYEYSIYPFWQQKEDGLYLRVRFSLNEKIPKK